MVQQGSGENKDHAQIQPQHQQDVVGQASVESAVCFVVVYIQGVQKGKNDPHKGSKHGAGKFFFERSLSPSPGYETVQTKKIQAEDHKGGKRPQQGEISAQNTGKRRKLAYNKIHNTVAVDQYQQAADDHNRQDNGVENR